MNHLSGAPEGGRAEPGGPIRGPAYLAAVVGLAWLYFVAGKAGLKLAFVHSSATAIWPPTGIALAAFLLLGSRVWPGIFAGAFLVNVTTAGSVPACLGIALGNTLEGLIGALLVRRVANGDAAFDRPADVARYAASAGIAATAVAATFGVAGLVLDGTAPASKAASIWLTWWLGDLAGALIVAPLLILWIRERRLPWTLEASAVVVALLLTAQVVFGSWFTKEYPLQFLCLPFLVWSAVRLDARVNATMLLLLAAIANWNTLLGLGPFSRMAPQESLLLLQAYLGVTWLMTMTLCAVASQRRKAVDALRRSAEELERRVTERTEELSAANARLQAGEIRLLQAQKIARLGSWEWDIAADRLTASDTFHEILGVSSAFGGTLGGFLSRIAPADRAMFAAAVDRARSGGLLSCEHRIVLPDGTERVVHTMARAEAGPDGAASRLTGTTQDVTERKRAEQERAQLAAQLLQGQKLQAVGQLAAGIAHEINNPIAFILSNLHTVAARIADLERLLRFSRASVEKVAVGGDARHACEELDRLGRELEADLLIEDFRSATADCREGAARIRDIVQNLRDFAHPDPSLWGPADLRVLAENALRLCDNEIKYKADVRREFGDVPPVTCHARQIEQVLVNVLLNAAQAIDGRGEIAVSTGRDDGHAVVRIRDTGCGIPKGSLERIFEPFYTTKPVGRGTGLGLHIAHKVVTAHGGRIDVASDPGRGTEVAIHLPIDTGEKR